MARTKYKAEDKQSIHALLAPHAVHGVLQIGAREAASLLAEVLPGVGLGKAMQVAGLRLRTVQEAAADPSTKAKISKSNSGKVRTEAMRAHWSKAHTGKKLSQEHKDAIRKAGKGWEPWQKILANAEQHSKEYCIAYVVKLKRGTYASQYKFGITTRSIAERHGYSCEKVLWQSKPSNKLACRAFEESAKNLYRIIGKHEGLLEGDAYDLADHADYLMACCEEFCAN